MVSMKIMQAQTFVSDTTAKQSITSLNQVFTHSFTNLPAGGWGNATLVIYYEGDFGGSTEYGNVADEDGTLLGFAGPYPSGNDCDQRDSSIIQFNAAQIDTWMLNGQVDFVITITGSVDPGMCTNEYFQCKLIYNYCSAGTPFDFAAFNLSKTAFCTYDDGIALSGTPATGNFSGNGVVGNTFSPAGLTPGSSHTITYTATDAIGCVTTATKTVKINKSPVAINTFACPNTQPILTTSSAGAHVWYYDNQLQNPIDTLNTVLATPITETTSYYVAKLMNSSSFKIDSLSVFDSLVVDHNMMSGDDRGGIAITQNYLFVVGDNNTVRANASDLTGQISLPIQDALFSDLKSGALYTLWNSNLNAGPTDNNSNVLVNSIRGLDDNMALTSEINILSTPFAVDYNSIMFTGAGFVGVYSGQNNRVYIINLENYDVTDLGVVTMSGFYGSENWASWGVLEYDGTEFSGVYRSNGGTGNSIVKKNFTTGVESIVKDFPLGISDLSSFTISPWNNRWYFHHENSSGTFGGTNETMGYASAGSTITPSMINEMGCYTEIEVIVNKIDLGADTTMCQNQAPYIIFAGNGYTSYTWNGVNNNYNAFPISQSGTYIVDAIDVNNCTISDTIEVTFDACAGIDELTSSLNTTLYPNPTSGATTLSIDSKIAARFTVSITDVSGKVIDSKEINMNTGNNEFSIETASLRSGIYLLSIDHAELGRKTIRFVKN